MRSLTHLLPYESFTDAILGGFLRLKGLVSTEPHYELYAAESLTNESQQYEARSYMVRDLSTKERNYRIRNLKRCTAKTLFVGSLEQAGKKWAVLTKAPIELEPLLSKQCSPMRPVWWTKEEYESAFPVLGKSKPPTYRAADIGISWRDALAGDSYNASFATALEEELVKKLDPNRLLQVINLLRKQNECQRPLK